MGLGQRLHDRDAFVSVADYMRQKYLGGSDALTVGGGGYVKETTGGPQLLHTIDWTPATFSKTQGAGGLDPNSTATYHWACDESAGSATLDESLEASGTYDLSNNGTGIRNFTGQTAAGLCDGTNLTGHKCIEFIDGTDFTNDMFNNAGNGLMQASAGSVAVRVLFRISDPTWQTKAIVGTHLSGGGYWAAWLHTTGSLRVRVNDGGSSTLTLSETYSDGAWHLLEVCVNWSTDLLEVRTDLETTSLDISGRTQANVDSDWFGIGQGVNIQSARMQVADIWAWTGAAAEALSGESFPAVIGADPQAGTMFEIDSSQSSTGTVWAQASDSEEFCAYSFDAGQIPVGYSEYFETLGADNGFGIHAAHEFENLCTESERIENWTASNVTVSAAAADMVDSIYSFRQARKLTASADNGTVTSPTATLIATDDPTAQVWVKTDSGTETGRIILWDGSAEDAATAFTATTSWQLVSCQAVDPGAGSYSVRVEIDTNGGVLYACSASINVDLNRTECHIPNPTFGAAATAPHSIHTATAAISNPKAGTMEYYVKTYEVVQSAGGNPSKDFVLWSGPASRIRHRGGATGRADWLPYDGGGKIDGDHWVTPSSVAAFLQGYHSIVSWDSENTLSNGSYSRHTYEDSGGVQESTDLNASTWTADEEFSAIQWGHTGVQAVCLVGLMRVWDGAEAIE